MKSLIIIGIITYKRPKMLDRALESLKNLVLLDEVLIELIIIDNDKNGSAKKTVQKRSIDLNLPVKYFIEKKRGIPFARNRVVKEAIKLGATEIAFFDDDEFVSPDWLAQLYGAYIKLGCDIVSGPVVPIYPENPPPWALKGKFYEKERFKNGTIRNWASTSNILFDIKWFKVFGFSFNEAMPLSGGTDTYLTKKIVRNGGVIRWVDTAIVYEALPFSRLTIKWLMQRHYRVRLTEVKNSLKQNGILYTYAFSLLNCFKYSILFLLNVIFSPFLGYHYFIKALTCSARAWAVLGGLVFFNDYEEYRTVHGE